MDDQNDRYPAYARAERIADGAIHALGVVLAIAGAVLLILLVLRGPQEPVAPATQVAVWVYALALMATFLASACYHMTPWESLRPTLRRIDHAAIYLKIAGTYTPLVALIGSGFAWGVLGLVWALALAGAAAKLFFWRRPGRLGTAVYLVMGWLSVALIWPLFETLQGRATALVVTGGLLYTAGVVFYLWESLRFSNAIWHGFVLAASGCFFAAICLGIVGELS